MSSPVKSAETTPDTTPEKSLSQRAKKKANAAARQDAEEKKDERPVPALKEDLVANPEWLLDCYRLRIHEEFIATPQLDLCIKRQGKSLGEFYTEVTNLQKANGTKGGIGCRGLYKGEYHWACDVNRAFANKDAGNAFQEEGIAARKQEILADFVMFLMFAFFSSVVEKDIYGPDPKKFWKDVIEKTVNHPRTKSLLGTPIDAKTIDEKWRGKLKGGKKLGGQVISPIPSMRLREMAFFMLKLPAAVPIDYKNPSRKEGDDGVKKTLFRIFSAACLEQEEEEQSPCWPPGLDRWSEELDEVAETDDLPELAMEREWLDQAGGVRVWRELYRELFVPRSCEDYLESEGRKIFRDVIHKEGGARDIANEVMREMLEQRMIQALGPKENDRPS